MSTIVATDINHDNVGRTINALDPVNAQDYVTKFYFEGLRYRMTTLQATTLATYGNLTQLTSASLPIGNYSFTAGVRIQSANVSNGIGLRIGAGTATINTVFADWRIPQSNPFALMFYTGYSQLSATDDQTSSNVGAANTDFVSVGQGFFSVTVAGTVAIQFRSENAGAAVTVGVGSFFSIERLP